LRSPLHKASAVFALLAGVLLLGSESRARAADASHVLLVEDDGRILSPAEPLPLGGRRLTFTPTPLGGYGTRIGPSRGLLRRGTHVEFPTEGSARIELQTPVVFFGKRYDEIHVHPQGAVSFGAPLAGAPRASASGQLVSGILGGPPAIAALWNELVTTGDAGRGVFIDQTPGGVIVTWYLTSSVRPAGGTNTFRLTLSADGTIDLDYGAMTTRWGVVGLSPGNERDGVRMIDFASAPRVAPRTATLAWYRDLPQLNEIALSRAVHQRLPDRFQFLTVFTSQPVDGPTPVWSTTVRNEDRGIGMPVFDHGALFGSNALEHVVVMNDVGFYADDPTQRPVAAGYAYAPSTLAVLAHEIGHRWLAYAGAIDQGLAGVDGHWSYVLESGASFLGGNQIRQNDDGSFTTTAAMRTYGPLDRYLMGFAAPEEVEPFFVVDDAHGFLPPIGRGGEVLGADAHPEEGVRFQGTRRDVTIGDVIERTGPRRPDAQNARTTFRMATVLVVPAGGVADRAQLAKVEHVRRAFGPFFRDATGHRARMQTWLPANPVAARTSIDPALIAGRPRVLDATVRLDGTGRGEVVLDYADFDGDLTALEVSTDASPDVPPTTVDVAQGTLGNRRGSLSFVLRDVPPEATQLQIHLVDNRGLSSRAAVRFARDDGANPVVASR
jgi:hypothetical protein